MKTPHLDNLINDLKAYDRNDMLSDDGRNELNEYEAIKRALSIANVVGQSEQLKAFFLFIQENAPNYRTKHLKPDQVIKAYLESL